MRTAAKGSTGNRRRVAGVAAGMKAIGWSLCVVLALLVAGCGGSEPAEVARSGSWERLPDPPLGARTEATIVGVGDDVLVFGGTSFLCPPGADCALDGAVAFADGAAFDRSTRRWRRIADLPSPTTLAATAVIGDVVFALVGGLGPDERRLVAYDVGDDAWVAVETPAALRLRAVDLVAAGGDLVLYATTDELGPTSDWRYDPERRAWERLPDDPLGPAFDRQLVWNGSALFLFDNALVASPGGADGPSLLRAARLEGSAWSVLPTADAIGPAPTLVDGDRLIAPALGCSDGGEENGYGRCIPYGSILDTRTSTWSALPGGPSGSAGGMDGFGGRSPDGLVGGSASGGPFYDAAEDAWVDLPPLDPEDGREAERVVTRLAVPAGDALVVVGGSAWGPDGGALLADAHMWSP